MKLSARLESFDSFWEAPENIQKGYAKFAKFYRRNYLQYIEGNKDIKILVVSCGPGYFVSFLNQEGYKNVIGIDSDPEKVKFAKEKGLPCESLKAFEYLENQRDNYDVIIAEQEINHLTIEEILEFLRLVKQSLKKNGQLIAHSINGANPITGAESLTQNIDHFNSFTEYSLKQIFEYANFSEIEVFPLNLYIFFENPLNYVGLIVNSMLNLLFRIGFIFYGKENKIFSKKIGAVVRK